MTSITQNLRYLPHTIETRYHAVKTYRNGATVSFIYRRYTAQKTRSEINHTDHSQLIQTLIPKMK